MLINGQTVERADASSVVYGLDVSGMFLVQGALTYLVVEEYTVDRNSGRSMRPTILPRFRRISQANFVMG